ncbi:MAG: divergent PAP2 family protein [Chloroflexota bacterium]
MNELLSNRILVIPIGIWFLSQVLKVLIGVWMERRFNPQLLFTAGGMPSSHSALVASVTTTIAHETGVDSPLFGAAAVFSAIIMYDAAGVRRTVGTHARVLNLILDELLARHQLDEERLRELVGHTPLQVVAGALMGLTVTLWWLSLWGPPGR